MVQKTTLLLLAILPALGAAMITLRQAPNDESIVYSQFHVDSVILARYATTAVSSTVLNRATVSQELSFQVQLPETAFISNFTMTVNGTTYFGIAKEKAEAQREFEIRQQGGENVGLVESRGTNVFNIRINTAAMSEATFGLEYEELIIRRLSKFQQILNLNPGRKVEDFRATVRAIDEQGIATFGGSEYVEKNRLSANEVEYTYAPSVQEQDDETYGLARDMMIEYDTNHPSTGAGLIVVNDCYFAQYFSPSGIERVPVDIIFVIDTSGSMGGRKIEQTREALETIINQLRSTDRFTMVTFDTNVYRWQNRLVSSDEYRQQGVQFARGLQAGGSTNFHEGLQTSISILKENGNPNYVQLLVILTDGQPTVGITDENMIVSMAASALEGTRISLNCLGFGFSLNFLLLQRLALENNGIARRIYEESDAAQQLEGFFEEISSPILQTIRVTYPEEAIETISQVEFPLLFDGSELVIAGKFSSSVCIENPETVSVQVTGTGASETPRTFTSVVDASSNTVVGGLEPSTERLVAYLSIQQLLDQRKIADENEVSAIEAEVLELALQYNFVTELTSLIVVQENALSNFTLDGNNNNGAEDGREAFAPGLGGAGGSNGGDLFPNAAGGGGGSVIQGNVLLMVGGLLALLAIF